MIKLRLTGSKEQIEKALQLLKKEFHITEVSEPQKNRNSNYYRIYATVQMLEDTNRKECY